MTLLTWQLAFKRAGLAAAGLVLAVASPAQVPALLPGQWELRQIAFVANQTVSHDIMERMDNP